MLGKLIKHDLKATWKVAVSLDAVLLLLGILTALMIQALPHVGESFGMGLFMFSFMGLFYIGIIAANLITLIYLVVRYYRNLYTSEGYLTFTLPVKSDNIFHSKVITGALWMFLSYLFTFIALAIMGFGFMKAVDISWDRAMQGLSEVFTFMGMNDPKFCAIMLITILITPVAGVVSMYFCISIGQLWQEHKVLGAVLCVVGLYVINQIVTQAVFLGSGFWSMMTMSGEDIDASFGLMYSNMFTTLCIVTVIETAIYYAFCLIINRKKVNLD